MGLYPFWIPNKVNMNTMNTSKQEKDQRKELPVSDLSTVKDEVEKLAKEKNKPELVSQFKNLLARNKIQTF